MKSRTLDLLEKHNEKFNNYPEVKGVSHSFGRLWQKNTI